jgi:monothiol glutaredoxin
MTTETQTKIESYLKDNKIMLFMKGVPQAPQCGFSNTVVGILSAYNQEFHTCNILEDYEVREGIKEYSDWPTIPQLYVNNEFVGGCDIIISLHESGELKEILA